MRKKLLIYTLFLLTVFCVKAYSNQFYPEFDRMKMLKCDVNETVYNQDNSVSSNNSYHRYFRIDDENSKIYNQKDIIGNVLYFGIDRIDFKIETLSDDYIIYSKVSINRQDGQYSAESKIIYDNPVFGEKHSNAIGKCEFTN